MTFDDNITGAAGTEMGNQFVFDKTSAAFLHNAVSGVLQEHIADGQVYSHCKSASKGFVIE